ncbi:thioredoxin family protein [Rhodococcus pyridinivorans]|uniref:Thioredoxin family protein n=3 Tax=Rhodococcus TaxID=1827 RepID=A0A419YYP5_9NOCA|nr:MULTISPECIES: hypothetical protein [Rhodococcus]AOD24843.1 alkylmercury lyase [Rhodococcus sp. p52]AYA27459.1 thioredoxin family protein [Rhodococcus rhodochrous]EHK81084.1 putative alkylmercury lyase [Rhodococcus pyridinivorans AK37]KHJ71765.1 alkylmercury lyase [Rhodococcus sp. Chr-9]MBX4170868.1 thioredoxin family protein [Rhodococcus sp. DMU2021]
MDIELLYFDGCPNWQLARDRLAEALAATGNAGTPIRLRRIETPEAAERAAFAGSPTIRIDGIDPFGPTEGVGLTCRVYRTADGPGGAPSTAELIDVLRRVEGRQG